MVSRKKMSKFYFGVFFYVFCHVYAYNIDMESPVVIENPGGAQEKSYFGYSLALYRGNGQKWIKIGAPNATLNRDGRALKHSGAIYHCPILDTCKIDKLDYSSGDMSNARMGSAMDISYDHDILAIGANGWYDRPKATPGAVFVEDIKEHYFHPLYSPLDVSKKLNNYAYNRFAASGSSLQFINNETTLLVGAPGVYNFIGTILKIDYIDRNREQWKFDGIEASGNFFEYSGYAVTSGHFFTRKQLNYVTGVPRGLKKDSNGIPLGSIWVMAAKPNGKYEWYSEIYGTQFGEYFGSALTAGDLDGDGLDDLVVGAPYRMNAKTGFNHGSVYVFYGNKRGLRYYPKNRIDSLISGSMFGKALMLLGHLDSDEFPEVAISAINEETCGAIYIYTYDGAFKSLMLSQKILGKELWPSLRGFGMSISRAIDIDENGSLDFAVGSPLSSHVIILRTKPIVSVHGGINGLSTIKKYSNQLSFKCCYFFKEALNSSLTIARKIIVDADFNRFSFSQSEPGQNSNETHIVLVHRKEICESIVVHKFNPTQNYNDSIKIILSYSVATDSNQTKGPIIVNNVGKSRKEMNKLEYMLSKTSKKTNTKYFWVGWDHNCVHNNQNEPCKAELETTARFLNLNGNNTFTIGSKQPLFLQVTIVNHGDPAFSPALHVTLPSGVVPGTKPADCQISGTTGYLIVCEGNEVLYRKVVYNFTLNVIAEDPDDLMHFSFTASTITDNNDRYSTFHLDLKLKIEAAFFITGSSKESSYVYEYGQSTLIENIFKVEKLGISPTPPVKVDVIIPYKISLTNGKLAQFNTIAIHNSSTIVKCTPFSDIEVNRRRRDIEMSPPGSVPQQLAIIDCPGRGNIVCGILRCMVGPFDNTQTYAEIQVDIKVDLKILDDNKLNEELLIHTDKIHIVTEAFVNDDHFNQIGNQSNSTQLINVILIYKAVKVALWIPVVSLLIGLGLLMCLSVCLAKAGFFRRKTRQQLRQLKDQQEEEDRLIDEMIRKEMEEAGEPMEATDLMLRWKIGETMEEHLTENDIYGALLLHAETHKNTNKN